MTLHLIPNRKTYVHRGIVLRDEKDFERAMKSVSHSDDDRKLLQQEQAQATDEDKRKVEEWNAVHLSKFEDARIKLKAYVYELENIYHYDYSLKRECSHNFT